MKQIFTSLIMCAGILGATVSNATNFWHKENPANAPQQLQVMHPTQFLVYTVDDAAMKLQLWNVSSDPAEGIIIALPLPNGTYRDFKVWSSSLMPDELAAKYPGIKSFTGFAVDNPTVTAKLDYTLFGFDAMIYDGENTSFIDPYDNYSDGFYMVHYKRYETRELSARMKCEVGTDHTIEPVMQKVDADLENSQKKMAAKTTNGWTLRTYNLALCADHFYCQAATGLSSPTIAQALSKMTISMNRINGVYNREFSVQMNFVTKEDTLIWPTNTGSVNGSDPFNTIDANASACLTANQTQCNNRIGSANYNVGHVFTTGGGGLSSLGVVCNNTQKAQSVTGSPTPTGDGYDIDYVAHEMGHEFGANHTFNNGSDGSCGGGNRVGSVAYEPGSGSTIMAYAGICSPDDLSMHSDAYFHAASLTEIVTKLNGSENACAVSTATSNKLVSLATFSTSYAIPYKTPFELIAPTAVDSVADTLTTYCWEQYNKAGAARLVNTFVTGPIFRSYNPTTSTIRVFPKVSMVMAGTLSDAGVEGAQGEKAPDTARYLTFKLTVRDILNGNGCILFADDTIHINAVSTGSANGYAGFKVTSQSTAGITYVEGTTQTVTWNVVGTNAAPVSAANVDIYMSVDGGNTWPYNLGNFPNNGTASVTIPTVTAASPTSRFKVKGSGNVFFNVNGHNFTVATGSPSLDLKGGNMEAGDITVFPNPASDMIHISTLSGNYSVIIYNAVGQTLYHGTVNGMDAIQAGSWARGLYYARFRNEDSGTVTVKPVVLE